MANNFIDDFLAFPLSVISNDIEDIPSLLQIKEQLKKQKNILFSQIRKTNIFLC
jgi:hypothetical protein